MSGKVFRRAYRGADGTRREVGTYTLRYYDRRRGCRVDESTGITSEREARALLRRRLVEIEDGTAPSAGALRTTIGELFEMLRADYATNRRRSSVEPRLAHLEAFFGLAARAKDVDEARVTEYTAYRLAHGAAAATINRELAALRRAFRLGVRSRRVGRAPAVELLAENNVRKGFLCRREFEAVCAALPIELRALIRTYYCTGWRLREVLSREWRHVDFAAGWLRMEPGETKNGRGRQFPLIPELRSALEAQRQYTDDIEFAREVRVQAVFHRAGVPVRDFRDAWRAALATAGLPTSTRVHDFRRTAARNLLRAGVPQAVAMSLMGHQTDAMFRRYAIVDEELLAQAGQRLQDLLSREPKEPAERRVVPIKRLAGGSEIGVGGLPPKLPPKRGQ